MEELTLELEDGGREELIRKLRKKKYLGSITIRHAGMFQTKCLAFNYNYFSVY
jgi:hypothetical protein